MDDAVEQARARRTDASAEQNVRIEWFINELVSKVALSMDERVRLATELVKNKIIVNISRPVTKTVMKRKSQGRNALGQYMAKGTYTRVSNRSKPGEFPKADTTQLMKTIFSDYRHIDGAPEGYVGTPLDYGIFLELKHDRSFMVRTLIEEHDKIMRILTGPIE
jgi:hypothetical protein